MANTISRKFVDTLRYNLALADVWNSDFLTNKILDDGITKMKSEGLTEEQIQTVLLKLI